MLVHTSDLCFVSNRKLAIVIRGLLHCNDPVRIANISASYFMFCFTLLDGTQGSERSSIVGLVIQNEAGGGKV